MNYHILGQGLDHKTVSCVFHFPIPTGNNEVAVTWRNALVQQQGGADKIVSVLQGIAEAELTAMKAGELHEQSTSVRFSSVTLTNEQRLAEIKAAWTVSKNAFLAEMQIILSFYGFGGDV